jgi:hypothetical protein
MSQTQDFKIGDEVICIDWNKFVQITEQKIQEQENKG